MLVRGLMLNLFCIGVYIGLGLYWIGFILDLVYIGLGLYWGKVEFKNVLELNWLEKVYFCYFVKKIYILIDNSVFFLV